jgi:hypothetical protein
MGISTLLVMKGALSSKVTSGTRAEAEAANVKPLHARKTIPVGKRQHWHTRGLNMHKLHSDDPFLSDINGISECFGTHYFSVPVKVST